MISDQYVARIGVVKRQAPIDFTNCSKSWTVNVCSMIII
jgi:hypothetical protein